MQAAVCPRFNYSTSRENRRRFLKISGPGVAHKGPSKPWSTSQSTIPQPATMSSYVFIDTSVHHGVWNDKFRFLTDKLGSVLIVIIPQGSPLLGSDQANQLVYGDERLDPVAMPRVCPHGQSVD
jgi:hypothetical protein